MSRRRCPVCGYAACVTSEIQDYAWMAYCAECIHNLIPGAGRYVIGAGDTEYEAIETWLADARKLCAVDQIPELRVPLLPRTPVALEALEQAVTELDRQQRDGWHLVDVYTLELIDGERVEKPFRYLETGS